MDEEDALTIPLTGGKWFKKMSVGSHLTGYDSFVIQTHFKGHTQGGFGGSNKNIGIGCADGRIGKAMDTYYTGTRQPMGYQQGGTDGTYD